MKKFLAALLLLIPSLGIAQYGPLADVTGVADGDVLNARSGPGIGFPIAWTFDPDEQALATFAQVQVGSATWVQVSKGERHGWVNQRFLTGHEFTPWAGATQYPIGLTCTGFEPGWILELLPSNTISFTSPEDLIEGPTMESAAERLSSPYGPLLLETPGGGLTAAISTSACYSAADAPYPYSAAVITEDDWQLHGCCHLPTP